jgi:hypothetical protein
LNTYDGSIALNATYMQTSQPCNCPVLNKEDWELKRHDWPKRAFYRTSHGQFLHMPIGIGGAIQKGMAGVKAKNYIFNEPYIILDEETGTFSADTLIAIEGLPTNDASVVTWEPTTVYSKYHHGSFKDLKKSIDELNAFVEKNAGKKPSKIYTWTSNCPTCWKSQGGPTVVLFARV